MNRFLKKEWEDTQIPEDVYLRTRNRAWARLQGKSSSFKGRSAKWIYAAGSLCAVALLVLAAVFTQTWDRDFAGKPNILKQVDAKAPEGRKNVAQGASPGAGSAERSAPEGRKTTVLSPLRGLSASAADLGLAPQAKLYRPSGAHEAAANASNASVGSATVAPVGAHGVRPLAEIVAKPSDEAAPVPVEQRDLPSRIVLNFQLPETGVRMIWIIDKRFDLDGGS